MHEEDQPQCTDTECKESLEHRVGDNVTCQDLVTARATKKNVKLSSVCAVQVIDNVIHKYEQGSQGAEVFQEYEKGLHALLGAFKASSPGQHFQIAEQDSSRLEKVCLTSVLCRR